jgi:hypothetical protein
MRNVGQAQSAHLNSQNHNGARAAFYAEGAFYIPNAQRLASADCCPMRRRSRNSGDPIALAALHQQIRSAAANTDILFVDGMVKIAAKAYKLSGKTRG